MARQVWFLRHGEAVPHGTRPDAARELTERGVAQGRVAGVALAALGCAFAHVLTSPKVRARDTALAAAPPLGCVPVEHAALAQGFDLDALRELVGMLGADERLLVVGHEPDFSQVVRDLTGARVDFKKGGVAGVRLTSSQAGELLVLLRPRELEAIAGSGAID